MANFADDIDQLADDISSTSETKGFWDIPNPEIIIPIKLALLHSEVTEALDVHRNVYDDSEEDPLIGMTDMQEQDFTEELADVIIRALDLAGYYELKVGDAVVAKIEKNANRPHKHNKRY